VRYPGIIEIKPGLDGYGISPVNDCRVGYSLYQCPGCGRVEKEALIGTYSINKTCTCNFPTCVYVMSYIGGWKHSNWIEFDERAYWEDKGLPTLIEGVEKCQKNLLPQNNSLVPNAKIITEEKSISWILQTKIFWEEKLKSLLS